MAAGTGLWFKGIDAHHLLLKSLQMRFDAKHVTRDCAELKRLGERMHQYEGQHDIDKIEEVQKKENEKAIDATKHSHRLITLDLLIFYGLIKTCERFSRLLGTEEKDLRTDKEMSREEKVVAKRALGGLQVTKADLKEIMEEIKRNLQKENGIILALEKIGKGQVGVALTVREWSTIKNRWFRYFVMRYETLSARRHFGKAEKKYDKLMPLILHIQMMIEKSKAKEDRIKALKDSLKEAGTHEKQFMIDVGICRKNLHALFVNDGLVLRLILDRVAKEINEDVRLAKNHEIPQSMAELDENAKKEILNKAGKWLQQERKEILQVWGAIHNVQT